MARRQRDHKAEYAARKAKARSLGYSSERDYKRARKELGISRRTPTPPKVQAIATLSAGRSTNANMRRLRRESREWSKAHSHMANSKYRPDMTDEQVIRYHKAFVEPLPLGLSRRGKAKEKRQRIHDYLVPDIMDEAEWTGKYVPQS